ncbi:hypothetical protein ACPOL_7233 (plasmid) [Acidisarcina polymorpha]|uniref:Single-stranded DNA-binding protein n=1 Tax=Acidisarcina polymorpha TaxID=2211140 RepID=A0A2Z5GB30_9BACT|nr:single-stranded DNA-binding protein [Acidisarcina polymorpha]AXC16423.1 hypothetical protein ACPOL_7233 [Acidisarcina polymorpha]
MEILNQVILAGNLTDKPSVDETGGRQFVRARLAQSWQYDTRGKTVEHRQFIPLTFFGDSQATAKTFDKGDNIHITGQLIRRIPASDASSNTTIFEIHVIRAFLIARPSREAQRTIHQNVIRQTNDSKQTPAFLTESINEWPV